MYIQINKNVCMLLTILKKTGDFSIKHLYSLNGIPELKKSRDMAYPYCCLSIFFSSWFISFCTHIHLFIFVPIKSFCSGKHKYLNDRNVSRWERLRL